MSKEIEYIHALIDENKLAVFLMYIVDVGEQYLLQKLIGLESDKHLRIIEDDYSFADLCNLVTCRLMNDAFTVVPKLSAMFLLDIECGK